MSFSETHWSLLCHLVCFVPTNSSAFFELIISICLYQKRKAKQMLPFAFPCKVICLIILLDELTALYPEHVHLWTLWDACIYAYMVWFSVRERERERERERDQSTTVIKEVWYWRIHRPSYSPWEPDLLLAELLLPSIGL